jgi:hypothetical protein
VVGSCWCAVRKVLARDSARERSADLRGQERADLGLKLGVSGGPCNHR